MLIEKYSVVKNYGYDTEVVVTETDDLKLAEVTFESETGFLDPGDTLEMGYRHESGEWITLERYDAIDD